MPQGRIVLKSVCQSRKLASLKTDGARLLYTWLLVSVDINGCFSGDPEVIKGQIFTRLKKSTKTILGYIEDLDLAGLIVWYQADGDIFLCIPDFAERQPKLNPDREAKPTIPLPTPDQLQMKSRVTPLKVKESKVKESKYTPEFEEFWKKWKGRWNKEKDVYIKVRKRQAFEDWQKLSVEEQRKAWRAADKVSGEFTPDANRWLKESMFDDY